MAKTTVRGNSVATHGAESRHKLVQQSSVTILGRNPFSHVEESRDISWCNNPRSQSSVTILGRNPFSRVEESRHKIGATVLDHNP